MGDDCARCGEDGGCEQASVERVCAVRRAPQGDRDQKCQADCSTHFARSLDRSARESGFQSRLGMKASGEMVAGRRKIMLMICIRSSLSSPRAMAFNALNGTVRSSSLSVNHSTRGERPEHFGWLP